MWRSANLVLVLALGFGAAQASGEVSDRRAELISGPWGKSCFKTTTPDKFLCYTYQSIDWICEKPVGSISLLEAPDESRLDIILRGRMNMTYGARITIDGGPRLYTAPLAHCFSDACLASYSAAPELLSQLKGGRELVVEAMDSAIRPVRIAFSLFGFAEAYDLSPFDPEKGKLSRERWSAMMKEYERLQAEGVVPQPNSCDHRRQP